MILGIRHYGLVVCDLAKEIDFYTNLLGFEIVRRMAECGEQMDRMLSLKVVRVETVKMQAPDGQLIELLNYQSPEHQVAQKSIFTPGFSHIALTVDNLDKEYSRLKDAGVEFNCEPCWSADQIVKLAFCKDPENNFVELVQVM